MKTETPEELEVPTFAEAFRFWLKLGFISFGGPAGQISVMHEELVERRRWISGERFWNALSFCMLLPGPEAQQLSTYIGWTLHGTRGGLVAGVLFVLPSAVLLLGLSWLYVSCGSLPWVTGLFYGLNAAVLAIVACAVVRMARKALKTKWMLLLALAGFCALFFFRLPYPLLILGAALVGVGQAWFLPRGAATNEIGIHPSMSNSSFRGRLSYSVRVASVGLFSWWLPVGIAGACLGVDSVLFREGLFFSKASMVTFGGAYAVLPYVAQQAVDTFSWISAQQMLDGLALAETTPGPLIIVLEFVGFLAAWNQPGSLPRGLSATLGAALTVWCTFVPSLMLILLGAPFFDRFRGSTVASSALSAVAAVVVGVILNLAIWFGGKVLVEAGGGLDFTALTIAGIASVLLWRAQLSTPYVVLGAGATGVIHQLLA